MANSIVIFGANGFVGQALIKALSLQNQPLIALSHKPLPSTLLASTPFLKNYCSEFTQPYDFLEFLKSASAVIHCASTSTPGKSAGQPLAEAKANLLPTLALIEAWQQAPHCRLLYLSSGGALYQNQGVKPALESSPLLPRAYYGAGKIAAEYFIMAACAQFPLQATILRPSNLYGSGQVAKSGFGIIANAFAHLKSNQTLTLWGDGKNIRDYLYIDDFIDLCLKILIKPSTEGLETFHAASGQSLSLIELLTVIEKVTQQLLKVEHQPSRNVDIPYVHLSTEKAKHIYGWEASTPLESGLETTWRWWQNHSGEKND